MLAACNAVVQVSMVSPQLDPEERGAPRFSVRMRGLAMLAKYTRRLIVRCQPYSPGLLKDVLWALPRYAAVGVHGITVEGLKVQRGTPGMVKLGGEFVYPLTTLRTHFAALRQRCHELGLRFYAAENRLRAMGDDTCCCGVADLPGFRVNRANLNALVAGQPIRYTRRMRERGTAGVFKALCQDVISGPALRGMSYADAMQIVARVSLYRQSMGLRTSPGAGRGDGVPDAATRSGGRSLRYASQRRELVVQDPLGRGGSRKTRRRGTGTRRGRRPDRGV
jgi:hypothetical protein